MLVLLSAAICLLAASVTFAQQPDVYGTIAEYEELTGGKIEKFSEAPMLRTKVAAGELPPVEQRLPQDPLVLRPYEEIGRYGGTIYLSSMSAANYNPALQSFEEPIFMLDRATATKLIPNIGKTWKFSNDGKTLTLYLRKGMKWSDGAPFTVDDMLFWWEDVILNDELTPVKPTRWKVDGELMKVKKIDDYTVEFNFVKPYWNSIIYFSGTSRYGSQGDCFLPKHALKKYHLKYNEKANELAKQEGYDYWWNLFLFKQSFNLQSPDIPNLSAWVTKEIKADGVIFERNPYYFKVDTAGNQLPYIDKVRTLFVRTAETHMMQMITGQIDFNAWHIATTSYPLLKENEEKGGYRVYLGQSGRGGSGVLYFNYTYDDPIIRDLFWDVRFRQALSVAINREELVEIVGLGHAIPLQSTVSPRVSFYEEEWGQAYIEYDIEKSNRMLDEMGLDKRDRDGYRLRPDGKRLVLTLSTVIDAPERFSIAELVKEYWEKVGVKTILNGMERTHFYTTGKANNLQIYIWAQDGAMEQSALIRDGGVHLTYRWNAARKWYVWWTTDGEKGEEPPEEMKRIWSLGDTLAYLPKNEQDQVMKEICDFQAENLLSIGTILLEEPLISSANLGNVKIKGAIAELPDIGGVRNNWIEEWFWKK